VIKVDIKKLNNKYLEMEGVDGSNRKAPGASLNAGAL
jgi:hypothetical protein